MVSPANASIEVEAGQEFVIILESSPTTGYRWRLIEPLDDRILELVGSEYIGPEDERIGAGGEEVLTFRALTTGTTRVSLGYARPWEKNVPPLRTRIYSVLVVGPRS